MLLTLIAGQPAAAESIDALIKKLGSPRFSDRQIATQQLLKRMPQARPALKKALNSSDLEIAQRARLILDEFQFGPLKKSLKRLRHLANKGKLDLLTEFLRHWSTGIYDDSCWSEVCMLTHKIAESSRQPNVGIIALLKNQGQKKPIFLTKKRYEGYKGKQIALLFVRADEVNLSSRSRGWSRSIIFATGNVQVERSRFLSSALFACGAVRIKGANGSIIVADGDVYLDGFGAFNSVVIARGNVICQESPRDSLIVSAKTVTCNRNNAKNCTIIENKPNPLGFIQFFDPTKEGITVEQAKNAVKIKHLAAKKPYAKAGLQNGDVITNINGVRITSPENFRRVLRKHVAWEEEMTLRVVRDGKELQIKLRPLVLP